MTVKEFRAILNEYPEEMRIVLEVNETSLEDVGIIEKIPVILDVNSEFWNGSHKECRYEEKHDEMALLIGTAS